MARAVFLDRDGVINEAIIRQGKPYSPTVIEELIVQPETKFELMKLKAAGFLLIVVTNQPDVARKKVSQNFIEQIHQHLMMMLPLDEIYVCYHDDVDCCDCRKPSPGMLLQAASKYQLNLSDCVLIGDRNKDILAGKKAGVATVWINRDYQEPECTEADQTVSSLTEAVSWILHRLGEWHGICQKSNH